MIREIRWGHDCMHWSICFVMNSHNVSSNNMISIYSKRSANTSHDT
nr:MAG TPA: hypothetical protein [Caudoviricetes sp.]